MFMKRTEWLEEGYIITDDFRNGNCYEVLEINSKLNGIKVRHLSDKNENSIIFISDADPTNYLRLSNIAGEYNKEENPIINI